MTGATRETKDRQDPRVTRFLESTDDALAHRIDWTGISIWHTDPNPSQRLVEVTDRRHEFRMSDVMGCMATFFLFICLGVVVFGILLATGVINNGPPAALVIAFGLFVTTLVIVALVTGKVGMVFDLDRDICYRGKEPTDPETETKNVMKLSKVYAIQLLTGIVWQSGTDRRGYEMNLVSKTGRRVHVLNHGCVESLREDADRLAEILGVQVWDATV